MITYVIIYLFNIIIYYRIRKGNQIDMYLSFFFKVIIFLTITLYERMKMNLLIENQNVF